MAVLQSLQPKLQVQWCPSYFTPSTIPQAEADTWVKLIELSNDYCEDEALLLCSKSDTEWFAWIPGYGEAVVNMNHVCVPYY